jgi:hypothetical protein
METRQENRPVSMSGASALLKLAMRLHGARSAEPCARDPPTAAAGVTNAASRAFGGRATATRLGEDLPNTRPQTERGDATTSPLPNAGLAKLVPVTASYVTPEIHSLPTPHSAYLEGQDHRDRLAAGIPESPGSGVHHPRSTRPETRMPLPPSNPQHIQAVIAVLIAIAAWLCVAYWRMALRVILVVLIGLAIYGAVAGVEGVTSLVASHHR